MYAENENAVLCPGNYELMLNNERHLVQQVVLTGHGEVLIH